MELMFQHKKTEEIIHWTILGSRAYLLSIKTFSVYLGTKKGILNEM